MVIRVWQLALALALLITGVPVAIYLIAHGHAVIVAIVLTLLVLASTTVRLRIGPPEDGTSEDREHVAIPPDVTSTVSVAMQGREDQPEFMNAQELASHLGVTERSVRRWIERGQLPAEKPGRTYVIRREDGERMRPGAFVEEHEDGERMQRATIGSQVGEDRSQLEPEVAARDDELAELRGRYQELQERLRQVEVELDAERRRAIRLEVQLERELGENHPAARAA